MRAMPTLSLFLLYLGAALLLATLLYYPIFLVVNTFWEVRPDRVFYRLAMLIAVLGFWPFLKLLGSNNREVLGYPLERGRFLRTFARGFAIGVMIMAIHASVLVLAGARVLHSGGIVFSELLHVLLSGLLSGVFVALVEETFFRGALHHHLRRSNPLLTTAIATSLLFAAVHFIRPREAMAADIGWHSGWELLNGIFHRYQDFAGFADSFIALFIAGLLLSLIRERTGNIALCIGIHAGWVTVIKLAGWITYTVPDSPAVMLVGEHNYITGWAAAALLGLITLWYWRYRPDTDSFEPAFAQRDPESREN